MKKIILILLLAVLSGCASYSQNFQQVETLLLQGKPEQALLEMEKQPKTKADRFLYWVDKAMLQRMAGLYPQSNQSFEAAKAVIEELDGISVVEQVGALTINDAVLSYEGESYEQVAIHVYAALNYIQLGLWDEARVEALQVDVRLKALAKAQDDDDANIYTEDAFSRYLTAFIYEQGGEWSDAMIAYRKAYQAYIKYQKSFAVAVPSFLKHDLLRLSKKMGLDKEYQGYQQQFKLQKPHLTNDAQAGEVVLLFHHALAPIKRAQEIVVYNHEGIALRISMPYYQSRASRVKKVQLHIGKHVVETVLVNDFDAIARASLEQHKPAMIARLIARTMLKKAAAKKAERNNGAFAGFLLNVAGILTETADTRSWLTLPKNIHFARLRLKAGTYPAKLSLIGQQGQVISTITMPDVLIQQRQKTVIEKTWLGLAATTP
ncbi:MAG: hypothetical protein Q9M19_07030 [Mariprofundaceae bacterium]|nr:hypothetical protein [Mariprofundaceae bacterium]